MQLLRETGPIYDVSGDTYQTYQEVEALAEAQPNMARERYAAYLTDADTQAERLIADTWTAAFFWPLTPDAPEPPTQATFARLQAGRRGRAHRRAARPGGEPGDRVSFLPLASGVPGGV